MGDYLSFCISLDGETTWFGNNLSSHSACVKQHGLKPETYREAEWIDDVESELRIRVLETDPHDEAWLRACVLAKWPARSLLENWIEENIPGAQVWNRMQTAGWSSTQTAGENSTQTAGDNSTQTAGGSSTQTAGRSSTQTAGRSSTQTAGGSSWQRAGKNSVQAHWSSDWKTRFVRIVPPEHENCWCFAENGTWRLATEDEEKCLNTKVNPTP